LLVVAGIGLVLCKNWGWVLGIATAALKLVRLVVLAVYLIGFVLPHVGASLDALLQSEMGRQLISHAIQRQQAQRGGAMAGPPPSPQEVVGMIRGSGTVSVIFFVCFSAIYPAIALILLCLPGARAACTRTTEEPFAETMPGS